MLFRRLPQTAPLPFRRSMPDGAVVAVVDVVSRSTPGGEMSTLICFDIVNRRRGRRRRRRSGRVCVRLFIDRAEPVAVVQIIFTYD